MSYLATKLANLCTKNLSPSTYVVIYYEGKAVRCRNLINYQNDNCGNNHFEADTLIWYVVHYLCTICEFRNIVIFSPDTDVCTIQYTHGRQGTIRCETPFTS